MYIKGMEEVGTEQSSLFKPKETKIKQEPSVVKEVVHDEEEVDDKPMCELKGHTWRDAWLKNSSGTKHVVYCTNCTRTKFDDDGAIQKWLLDQGYVLKENEKHQVTDFGYGKE